MMHLTTVFFTEICLDWGDGRCKPLVTSNAGALNVHQ